VATATATAAAESLAAAAASDRQFRNLMSALLIALITLLGGVLAFRFWRIKNEPFVLKAKPDRLS
ncbi:MAG: hypothetical protein KY456_16975, partial [Chloroflexi bacterium]|nr:hypothetical protein [Chloroflexota bacterium]